MHTFQQHIERFRKTLRRKGMDEKDIAIAMEIFSSISVFDQKLFPGDPASIKLCYRRSRHDFIAQYTPARKGVRECYTIFVPGLNELWVKNTDTVFLKELKIKVVVLPEKDRRKITSKEFAISVAAHEVRHRMQFRLGRRLKKFNSWTFKRARHPLLRKLGQYVFNLKGYDRKYMRRDGVDRDFIKKRTNGQEFDSKVIENLIIHRLKKVRRPEELFELMRIGPESLI